MIASAKRDGKALAIPQPGRLCPKAHGEMARLSTSRLVQFRCSVCGFVRQFDLRSCPPMPFEVGSAHDSLRRWGV